MNVPLTWLSEYVNLPKDIKNLTDKLTMAGHMLDKTHEVDGETVIDLELRGNRTDMFSLVGVARDVAAIFNQSLKLPAVASLSKIDPGCPLVTVKTDARELVQRYAAVQVQVKVEPSPSWLVSRLNASGIPSINNVVDITNYVMIETGMPMHAFDQAHITNGQLILRRAHEGEDFQTIQQGLTVKLSSQDLVIADTQGVQTLTMIGGLNSKVTKTTTNIILEAAVYHPGNCRRSARRLKIFTEAGGRLEKHLDPTAVLGALQRALYLLKKIAHGKTVGLLSDYYPTPVKPKTIDFDYQEITRLAGLTIPLETVKSILTHLEFKVKGQQVTVPTFRTDIEGSADLVEEVVRIYGYDQIPKTPISASTPIPNTYPSYALSEKVRTIMTGLGLNEVITLTMVDQGEIALVNPPDPDLKWLRTQIAPSLVTYGQRLLNLRQQRVALFEIGKCFSLHKGKFLEKLNLGIVLVGKNSIKSWNTQPIDISEYDLVGVLDRLGQILGIELNPVNGQTAGIYWTEINLDELLAKMPSFTNPYAIISNLTPIIEDVNISLRGSYKDLETKVKSLSPLIKQVELMDKYEDKLTLRITYHSDTKQLSDADIKPLRTKLTSLS